MPASHEDLKRAIKIETAKCMADPIYFIKKYCYIQHAQKGRIKFALYPFQEDCLRQFVSHDKNIVLKSRQLGISTLIAAYSLWMCLYSIDKNILVVATKEAVAKNLVTKVRIMYDNLPSWMKQGIFENEENNVLSIKFKTGSGIQAVSSASDSGRSLALSLLIIDEAAFIPKIEELWASVQPTLSTGGKAIILSTPNGQGGLFPKIWMKAESGTNGFNPIKLKWTVHPERDQKWRDQQTAELGTEAAAQECDCNFLTSGHTVIQPSILTKYADKTIDPIEKRGYDTNLWIWEYPDPSRDYIVVADVARGDGGDFSAFHIIDIETLTQVAEYVGKIDTKDYGNLLVNISTEYNDALLVIENANIGWAALQQAIDRGYKNIYYSYRDQQLVDPSSTFSQNYDLVDKSKMVPGFTTSSKTRPLIISKMELYCREESVIIRSKRLVDELYVFIWNGSKAEAQSGYNDDLVMSFAIAMWIRDTSIKMRTQGQQMTRSALSSISRTGGVADSYKQSPAIYNTRNLNSDPWKMEVKGKNESLDWLL